MSVVNSSVVQKSYARCSRDKVFFETFYERFLGSSEEIRNHFKNTSLAKKKIFIHTGIATMLLHAMGSQNSTEKLYDLARQHGAEGISVDPSLYSFWVESLLFAVTQHDLEYDDKVDQAWRETIQLGIKVFFEIAEETDGQPALHRDATIPQN